MAGQPAFDAAVEGLVDDLRTEGMPSARNLLVTVFGDAIGPYEASVSVGSLATLLAPLGVTERLVRTSLSRLVADEILVATRVQRRSFYGRHPAAATMFARAEDRIYRHPQREWDGRWTLVIIDAGEATPAHRATLRRELGWLGLGTVAPNVLASPVVPVDAVTDVVAHVGGLDRVLVSRSRVIDASVTMSDAELAQRCAPVDALAERYDEVTRWFAPVGEALAMTNTPDAEACFTARLLLIATFRRVILSDPLLPASLLPGSWSGHEAYEAVGRLYRRLHRPAERWLREVCETEQGPLPAAQPRSRFADCASARR